jgi:hypothetical protein
MEPSSDRDDRPMTADDYAALLSSEGGDADWQPEPPPAVREERADVECKLCEPAQMILYTQYSVHCAMHDLDDDDVVGAGIVAVRDAIEWAGMQSGEAEIEMPVREAREFCTAAFILAAALRRR